MDKSEKKKIIGILGGIGSGKSTVAAELAKLGCAVIDADEIAHELLEEAGVKEKIIGCFGDSILDCSGRIDRKKLAQMAFADRKQSASLNNIIHPGVLARTEELIEQYNKESQVKAIVLDMPLLVEVGWERRCDRLIFVDCKKTLRAVRAEKMGINENELKIRENFQISLDSKAEVSDNRVDNNSDVAALAKQVAEIFSGIVSEDNKF